MTKFQPFLESGNYINIININVTTNVTYINVTTNL